MTEPDWKARAQKAQADLSRALEALGPFHDAVQRFEPGIDYGASEDDGTPLFEHDDLIRASEVFTTLSEGWEK